MESKGRAMVKDIWYNKPTFYIGRNGAGKQIGLGLTDCGKYILLNPINSKRNMANCSLHIPIDQVPEIINTLTEWMNIKNPK
jgi:hypothetical protein